MTDTEICNAKEEFATNWNSACFRPQRRTLNGDQQLEPLTGDSYPKLHFNAPFSFYLGIVDIQGGYFRDWHQ